MIVELQKLDGQFDFKYSKLWILEPGRRLVLYQMVDEKLIEEVGLR